MDCQTIKERVSAGFGAWIEVRSLTAEECVVILPFWDGSGDPVTLCVSEHDGRAVIDDSGSIAGLLFSMGQHEATTPAYQLVESLQRAHGLEMDFGEGLVKLTVPAEDIYYGVAEMAKIVLSVQTVVPHMRVTRRSHRSLGPRLRTKIARTYERMKVLDLVERRHRLDGAKVEGWPIDFRWSIGSDGGSRAVNVVAADLGVAEPLEKAQRVLALSLDTRNQRGPGKDQLRVVIETISGSDASTEASEFLRFNGRDLIYDVFDLGIANERSRFFSISENELIRQAEERWADSATARC